MEKNTFENELKIVPAWAYVLAFVGLAAFQYVIHNLVARQPDAPPFAGRIAIGVIGGSVIAIYIIMIGYVNRDSLRRGMNRWLWTLLVILIPNAIGFLLYFLIRQPNAGTCVKCGSVIEGGDKFCRRCGTPRVPVCPNCGSGVQLGDSFCPQCGKSLVNTEPQPATQLSS